MITGKPTAPLAGGWQLEKLLPVQNVDLDLFRADLPGRASLKVRRVISWYMMVFLSKVTMITEGT